MTTPRAFPIETGSKIHYGMSLLDYFAARAMQALMSLDYKDGIRKQFPKASPEEIERTIAAAAYLQAEAMLAERERRSK
jgi:hypothetical protein